MDLAHSFFGWNGCYIWYSDMMLDVVVEITTTVAWLSRREDSQVGELLETLSLLSNVVTPCAW
jgi:hypothetical protein